ncbi:MAG: GntR family transcriptional regulator [Rhodoferax sp.]|nr:GntR family transcriptional regulator [Rhodoferax sp.]
MHPQEAAIHDTLAQTLLAGRLAPGSQLVETRLAQIFGVSRERVRKVLHRLGHERLLDLVPNRGCFVSSPTLAQAREIYEARRIIEGGIAASLAGRLTASQLEELQAHGHAEHAALQAGDRALSIRLSGAFHLLLAGFTDSPFVVRELQELVSRTSMLVAFFEPAAASECACEEHEEIVDALRTGDAGRAFRAMHVHLSLIETRLKPRVAAQAAADADQEIARAWAATQAPSA